MNKDIKVSLSSLLILFLLGSFSSIFAEDSKKPCAYEYFNAIATLKMNAHVSIFVEFSSKNPPFQEVKEFTIRNEQMKKLRPMGIFRSDELIPAKVGRIVKGICTQTTYKIREEYDKIVQTKILWFNDDYTDKDHSEEVKYIYKNFSALKYDFPDATLKIYGHFDKRKLHEYSSDHALSYADTIKKMLIKEGLSKESIQTFSYSNDTMPDVDSKKIYERVTFTIELNY